MIRILPGGTGFSPFGLSPRRRGLLALTLLLVGLRWSTSQPRAASSGPRPDRQNISASVVAGATSLSFSNTTPVAIVDNTAVISTIVVSGAGPHLHDLNLTTFAVHGYSEDLDITLTSPSGTVVTLTTDNGGDLDNVFNGTVWDDSANPGGQVPYLNNQGLVTDHLYANLTLASLLVPEEPLGAFIGENPNGTWTLRIYDDADADTGSLNRWSLEVTTLPAAPSFVMNTFTNSTALTIATGPVVVTSPIVVSGMSSVLLDVNLTMTLPHTNPEDLDITLTSPLGTVVTLSTDNGGESDNVFNGAIWDDSANPGGQVPYTNIDYNNGLASDHLYGNLTVASPLSPEEGLAAFVGESPNGVWTLTISDDTASGGGSLVGWSVTLRTALPEVAVAGNNVDIADGDSTPGSADHTEFGDVGVAGGAVVRVYTVTNRGLADLALGMVMVSGANASDFIVTSQPLSTLAGGASAPFHVTFGPSAAGLRSAALSFANNDSNESPFNFNIQGTGVQVPVGLNLINSFGASHVLVPPGESSTLSWSAVAGATLTLNAAGVSGPDGSVIVNPTATTTYTLLATGGSGSESRSVTVQVNDGAASLPAPTLTSPPDGAALIVTGVGFGWTFVPNATGYGVRVFDGLTGNLLFSGSLLGGGSTSTLISLPAGSYRFAARACSSGFEAAQCGRYGSVAFTVTPSGPSGAPTITLPAQGVSLTASTQNLSWTAVTPNPALSGLTYEVLLRDLEAGTTALQITVPSPNLSTIFTMKSSALYELKVRASQASCGPYSMPVTFAVALPPVPTSAPIGLGCSVSGGNSLTCNWNSVVNADAYQVQVVQPPPAGPGGGALTAAARQVSATAVTLPVPEGAATVFIAACNGDGCGPNATTAIDAFGPNPSQANIGTPMAGTVVTGPGMLFTWNRVPGDNGANTSYRLFVQDLSRQATALDVFTTSNFYSAFFKAEGARYDALVVSNPGLPGEAAGPSQGFNVAGASASAPTMVSPAHNSSAASGNIQLGWSPVPGATLYQYFVAVLGQGNASASGVTPGLVAQVPLIGSGAGTVYSGIVRACPMGATCLAGLDAGWGPWSNAPGGPGVTNFTVLP